MPGTRSAIGETRSLPSVDRRRLVCLAPSINQYCTVTVCPPVEEWCAIVRIPVDTVNYSRLRAGAIHTAHTRQKPGSCIANPCEYTVVIVLRSN